MICHHEGLELNGTHELQVYPDSVYILSENINNEKKKNRETLLQASGEVGQEVNTEN
jgi:hypothetical protein